MNKLLEEAKASSGISHARRREYTREEMECVIAYLEGEITATSLSNALGNLATSGHATVAAILRQGLQNGWVEIKMINN